MEAWLRDSASIGCCSVGSVVPKPKQSVSTSKLCNILLKEGRVKEGNLSKFQVRRVKVESEAEAFAAYVGGSRRKTHHRRLAVDS